MSSDLNPHPKYSDPATPASQAELTALALRVGALEAQLAALAPARFAPTAPFPIHEPASRPAPPPEAPPLQSIQTPPPPRQSFEDRLGSQIFNFVGAAALIIGASWALKLAFEHGLIGPSGRILIGLAAGAALILWSGRFRRRALPAFSYSLKAVGSGILYLALWASFQLYHLLPAPAVFAAMLLVTAWNAFMAWSQDAELLAAYALAGGLATPLLLSTGGDHETFLFLYLATLDAAIVLLLRFKPWPRLLPPAYLATAFYFIAWYSRFFHPAASVFPRHAPTYNTAWDPQSTGTTFFILLFFIVFALPSLRHWIKLDTPDHLAGNPVPHSSTAPSSMSGSTNEATLSSTPNSVSHSSTAPSSMSGSTTNSATGILLTILLPLANAAFLSLALYSVFQDSGLHSALPWLMLALSALYLALMRIQATSISRALHLALAVVFLTVAIPLKASGHTLTTAWLVEGLVLYWVSGKFRDEGKASPRVLHILSAAGFVLGLLSLTFRWVWFNYPSVDTFFTPNLGAALVALACLAGTAWLAATVPSPTGRSNAHLTLSLTAINLVALLLLAGELFSITGSHPHPAFRSTDFLNALLALGVLAAASWSEHRLAQHESSGRNPLRTLAAASFIAFNLFALLTGVREISAFWDNSLTPLADANLQRSLAISAFLMLYGAALLAAGFWRRAAFVRWQALILLIFTILKVFLYDVSGLSQGYRVASFLGLGALLMAVSFAYQKDWLGLKAPPPTVTPEDPV